MSDCLLLNAMPCASPDCSVAINQIFKFTGDARAIHHDVYHRTYIDHCSTALSVFSPFLR